MQQRMKVSKVVRETHDTVTLALEGSEKIPFKPGQFVMVELLGEEKAPKRAYSISSSPTRSDSIEITIKEMPDGWVSKMLNRARIGDEMDVTGPYGHFVFDGEKMKDIVLLAAGSGIAPFRCFCQYIMDTGVGTKITFVYGNKTAEDIIFESQLREFAEKIPNLDLILTLSREEREGYRAGRIDNALIKEIAERKKDAHYFICGPPKMVENTKSLLLGNGIEREMVKIEVYG